MWDNVAPVHNLNKDTQLQRKMRRQRVTKFGHRKMRIARVQSAIGINSADGF